MYVEKILVLSKCRKSLGNEFEKNKYGHKKTTKSYNETG